MGQKGSKEVSGRENDGTLVEALFIDHASAEVNEDSDNSDTPVCAKGKRPTRAPESQETEEKGNESLSPRRQNLFQEDLDSESNGKDKCSKQKSKPKKLSFKKRAPSRKRSSRVAPSLSPDADQEAQSDQPSVVPQSYFEAKKDVCVEIDDETNEASMDSETESIYLRAASDSETDAPTQGPSTATPSTSTATPCTSSSTPCTNPAIPSTSTDTPSHSRVHCHDGAKTSKTGSAIVTIGAVRNVQADGSAKAGEPPEDTLDDEYFNPMQLYNAMNDGQLSPYLFDPSYILIVDTRDKAFYHDCHIVTAFHISDLENPDKIGKLEDYTIIVLYDTNGFTYSLTDSTISQLVDDFSAKKLDPVILKGGYDAFYENYPFLCCDKIITSEAQRQKLLLQHPSEIIQGQLYLGRGDQATNSVIVNNLGITHIVNITTEHKNAFKDRIKYLGIRKEDEPSSDLHSVVLDIIQFTGDALLAGGRVFIHCNLGRSRSATAVIAYLIATRRWTLRDAYFYVKERRPIIDPNRGFLQQLAKFEKEILGDSISDPDELWMG